MVIGDAFALDEIQEHQLAAMCDECGTVTELEQNVLGLLANG